MGYCQSAASAWKKPGVKTAQVEAHMATYVWFIVAIDHTAPTLAHMTTEYWDYLTMDHDKFHSRLLTHGMHSG